MTTTGPFSAHATDVDRILRSTDTTRAWSSRPRIHLDLYAEDQRAEVERLLALGATEVRWDGRPPDADYVILADPEGNRFCVVEAGG
jgi:hypothetical protein